MTRKYGYTMQIPCPVRLRVWNDPLGPVNKIVALVREDGTLVVSKLHPVPVGAEVRLGYEGPQYNLGPGWQAIVGGKLPEWRRHYRPYALWTVTVDGRRILEVPEHETWPPTPPPPPIPLWQRMRRAWTEQWRADVDRVMGRLGWHRDGACGGEDW